MVVHVNGIHKVGVRLPITPPVNMKIKIVTLSDKNRKEISDVTFPTLEKFSINTGIELTRHTSLMIHQYKME